MDASYNDPDGITILETIHGVEDDCRFILLCDSTRFILLLRRPIPGHDCSCEEGLFEKLDLAFEDTDEMVFESCLEDVREELIDAFKGKMRQLASESERSSQDQSPLGSLERWLFPTTFVIEVETIDGRVAPRILEGSLAANFINDSIIIPRQEIPHIFSNPSTPIFHSSDLTFVEDLWIQKVLKVTHNGQPYIFKTAFYENDDHLLREIEVLQQVSQVTASLAKNTPHIVPFKGLVLCRDGLVGFLEYYIEAKTSLNHVDPNEVTVMQRQKWADQIREAMEFLHEIGLVWGDVKPENILLDNHNDAWIIDFGGSWTQGWVDSDVQETVKGDQQGYARIKEFLGLTE
jgi:serine/threonine protein kinase